MARTFRAGAGLGGGLFAYGLVSSRPALAADQAAPDAERRPLVLCGPSGVGKGTLVSMLLKDYPDRVGFSISHTTRKPRRGEVNGVHYHFVAKDEMEEMIRQGKFVEYANVHGNIYGTSKQSIHDVAKAGKVCILDIDVQGAKSVARANLGAYFIFVQPPTFEDLELRLRKRGTESEEKIQLRLKNAKEELAAVNLSIWNRRLVNDDLQGTYKALKADVEKYCM